MPTDRFGHRAEIDLQSTGLRCGQRQRVAGCRFVEGKLMRDRRRSSYSPDRRCGVPALGVVTKAQNLTQRHIDGCSHRKRGADAGGRLGSSLCHGQQRGHQHYAGVGDAEGVDIVEIQRMTGNGVEERDPFDAALSDGTHRCCGLVPVKCRQ